jgi:hypothetical protein
VDKLLLVDYVSRLGLLEFLRGRLFASLKRGIFHDARMIGLAIFVVMRIVKLGVVVGVRRYRPLIIILTAFGVLYLEGGRLSFLPAARRVVDLQRFIMHGGELPLHWIMDHIILEELMHLMQT